MITVYIDVLFLVNFIINLLIIEGAGIMIGEEVKWYRSILGALVGALYAVMVFFPGFRFVQTLIMKIAASAIIVVTAFKIKGRKHFFKIVGSFYIVSFIFGGGIIALLSVTGIGAKMGAVYSNGTVYFDLPWNVLMASCAGIYFLIFIFGRIRRKKVTRDAVKRTLVIYINGKTIETKAIIDTGNSLCDPITGAPVIVCEYGQIERIIPKETGTTIEKMKDAGLKVRLIPFSSIGKERGLMPGFCPDRVKVDGYEVKKCVVGISEGKLSKEEDYHALLNPMITVT